MNMINEGQIINEIVSAEIILIDNTMQESM